MRIKLKLLSIILSAGMLVSSLPLSAFADEMNSEDSEPVEVYEESEEESSEFFPEVEASESDDISEESSAPETEVNSEEPSAEPVLTPEPSIEPSGTQDESEVIPESEVTQEPQQTEAPIEIDEDMVEVEEETVSSDAQNDYSGDYVYTVSGTSACITGYAGTDTDISIPSTINGYKVTSIGDSAFKSCSNIKNVAIPYGVTSIGSYAFDGCSGLTSVTIGNSVKSIGSYAFSGCSGLTSIAIPDIVKSIGDSAFNGCSKLTSVTIPDGITSIGEGAFNGCSGLIEITLPFVGSCRSANGTYKAVFGFIFGVSEWYEDSCHICQYFSVSSYKYYNIPSNLKKVMITDASKIPYGAFYGCSNLTSISISNGVTSIGSNSFYNCSKLTSITVPDSVTSIGSSVFDGCSGLTSVTIGNSVKSIGSYAFSYCSSLASVSCPAEYADEICKGKSSIKTVVITSGTSIGSWAFEYCRGLTSVTIGNSVKSIGSYAFHSCSKLTSVTIGNSVKSIGSWAFNECESVKIYYSSSITDWDKIDGSENVAWPVICKVKVSPKVTQPKAKTLFYTGKSQTLVTAGSTTGGTIEYSLKKNGTYTTSIPKATKIGTYKVYYKVVGNVNYKSVAAKYITVKIGLKTPTLKTHSISGTKVTLSWSAVKGASKYYIRRSTSKKMTKAQIATVTSTSKIFSQSKGTTYYYTVVAVYVKNGVEYRSAQTAPVCIKS